jgi:hypothetical protein
MPHLNSFSLNVITAHNLTIMGTIERHIAREQAVVYSLTNAHAYIHVYAHGAINPVYASYNTNHNSHRSLGQTQQRYINSIQIRI